MSSSKRLSTELLSRHGIQKTTVRSQNRLIDRYLGDNGLQKSIEPQNISLSNQDLVPASISADDFFRAKDHFRKNGLSESNAVSMSLVANDMAAALNVSVASFLYTNSQNGQLLELQDYALMNVFRSTGSKVSVLSNGLYKNCLRSRDIIA